MKTQLAVAVASTILAWASPGLPSEIRPSFDLDHCAWWATHVVVVTGGDTIDGDVRVLEAWTGVIPPGRRLTVPELAEFRSTELRRVFSFPGGPDHPVVSGDRIVLFLRREGSGALEGANQWGPQGKRVRVSSVWFLEDHPHALVQVLNPGPAVMTRLRPRLEELRRRVDEITRARTAFREAAAIPDPEQRARSVARLLPTLPRDGVGAALDILGGVGEPALPIIDALLDHPEHADLHAQLLEAAARAGGKKAVPVLLEVIRSETAFFERSAPDLKRGWWNSEGLSPEETKRYRRRYRLLYAAVRAIAPLDDPRARTPVTALRDLWRSHPQYEDPAGLAQVSKACDDILRRL